MDLANGARLHQLADLDAPGVEPRPHGLHEEQLLLPRLLDQQPRLLGRDGERLLAQHVLARLERQHGVLEVVAVRRRDVDDVDVGVRHELGVGTVGRRVRGAVDGLDEVGGTRHAREGRDGRDLVGYVVDVADGGVREEVLAEAWGKSVLAGVRGVGGCGGSVLWAM